MRNPNSHTLALVTSATMLFATAGIYGPTSEEAADACQDLAEQLQQATYFDNDLVDLCNAVLFDGGVADMLPDNAFTDDEKFPERVLDAAREGCRLCGWDLNSPEDWGKFLRNVDALKSHK